MNNTDKEKLKKLLSETNEDKIYEEKPFYISPIPPPPNEIPENKTKLVSLDNIREDGERKLIASNTGWKKPNLFLKAYILPLIIFIFNIGGFVALLFSKELLQQYFLIALIFYAGLCTPLLLGLAGYLIIRFLFFDKNRLTGMIVQNVSKNFIVAHFFLTQKRTLKRVCLINKDGISFNIKDCKYTIDKEECFLDEDNYICGYWLPNIPNQLKFDFVKNKNNIYYSAKNLEVLMKDKIFFEFHNQTTPESLKIIMICLGLLGLAFVAIIVIIAIKG